MKKLFAAASLALSLTAATSTGAQAHSLPCDDYDEVIAAFEAQGTEYRGTTVGPNELFVHIFENVATNRGIAVRIDREANRICAVSAGFDYQAFTQRAPIFLRSRP